VDIVVVHEPLPTRGDLAVFAGRDGTLSAAAGRLDEASGGAVRRAIGMLGPKVEHGAVVELVLPRGLDYDRLLVQVLGEQGRALTPHDLERAGAALVRRAEAARLTELTVASPAGLDLGLAEEEAVVALATGAHLRAWRFDAYRSHEPDAPPPGPAQLRFLVEGEVGERLAAARAVWEASDWARRLVAEPANVLYPESFARELEGLSAHGVEVEVFGPERLEELGLNALLAVGRGSARPPYMVVMRWRGASSGRPLALVGKGVCFDSGGISIKPAQGMHDMKWDMAGAAAVAGAMRALAARRAPVDVVAAVGLAENMPSGTAQRPGDIVRTYAGKTVEVLNTDAEGRLVLADVIGYVVKHHDPEALVDLATLTGAIIVALGKERAGLFATDDTLADQLLRAGEEVGERLWRMPLDDAYREMVKGEEADLKNVGRGREAGAIAGAAFLAPFVGERPWAHLDIAGMAWADRERPLVRKGATGFGVRLLDRFVTLRYGRDGQS